jgi:hypothetical protein
VVLNADQKGMFIQNAAGETKLSVRTGNLSSLTAGTVTNTPTTISHSALTFSTNGSSVVTFATSGFSANLQAGSYSFTLNSTSITGTITHSTPASGYFSISYGYEILNSSNVIEAFIGLGGGTSTGTGGSVIGINQTGTISVSTTGTYTIRPRYVVNIGFSGTADVTFPAQTPGFSPGTITFSRVTNFAELTDSGLQVVTSDDNFVTIERGGQFEISSRGVSYFEHDSTGGSDNALRISGSITPWVAEVGNLGQAGQAWAALHTVRIFAPNLPSNIAVGTNRALNWNSTQGQFNYSTSTERHKKDILVWNKENILEKINNINPVTFKYKHWTDDDAKTLGFIAEHLDENELYEAVHYEEVSGSILPDGIDYEKMTTILWKGVQQLSKKVNDLELIISGSNNL